MKTPAVAVLILALGATGCVSHAFPPGTAADARDLTDGILEVSLDAAGDVEGVEFHLPVGLVPVAVRAAADREIGPGDVVGVEKEYVGGALHWEVTKRVGGKEVEVLFDPAGTPVNWEVEVDASAVPGTVLAAADAAAGGTRTKVERILDRAKTLTAYHIKKRDGNIRYKIVLTPAGAVVAVYREVPAEVEVRLR